MRFLIAGGGTGGHIFPGIAIAQALKRKDPHAEVRFVGTERGLESRVVPQAGFELHTIDISGLKAKSARSFLEGLLKIPLAIWESIKILRHFDPEVVIGVGGYASGPVLLAAWLLRIPRAICEQNSVPGWTNKILGRFFVPHIWGVFEKAAKYFPLGRYQVTGNPLRENFMHRPASTAPKKYVLVLGGSLGARPLNEILPEAFARLAESVPELEVIHQTGSKDLEAVRARYQELGLKAEVLAFIDDMPAVYEGARLVVARAGATTCSELTALGVPSILIPFPQAADDHQTENANELVRAGAALVVRQDDMNAQQMAGVMGRLLLDLKSLENMANKARQIGKANASDFLAQKVLELC